MNLDPCWKQEPAVSLQTAPALLGTALLRLPSFCLHVSFFGFILFFSPLPWIWVTRAGAAAAAAIDVLCMGDGILHAASTCGT